MRDGGANVDVAIVGGGPAGATLAALLASRGVHVLVADADDRRGPALEVLPPTAIPILTALGLLAELEDASGVARRCLGVVRRWGTVHERHDYLVDAGGRGWVIDRAGFDEKLKLRAPRAGATWRGHTRLERVVRRDAVWKLTLRGPEGSTPISARFLVDASGRSRAVARRIGITTERTSALIATWPRANGAALEGNASWLHVSASHESWSYALPDLRGRPLEVALSIGAAPGYGRDVQHVSACTQRLVSCVGDGWAAVGDAAVAFDPITSQGLSNALASARALAPVIETALADPKAGEASLLRYRDAMNATFQYAEQGARQVYRTALRSLGGAFWQRMSTSAASSG